MNDVYHHLRAFGLAKKGDIKRRLDKLPGKYLERFIEGYLEVASQRPIAIEADPGATDIYPDSWSAQTPISIIKRLSIYSNRIYIHDPLVRAALDWGQLDSLSNIMIHHSRDERVSSFKSSLAYEIEELLELQPLVNADIVYLAPTDLVYPRPEPNAIYSHDFFGPDGSLDEMIGKDSGEESLPAEFIEYYKNKMVVVPAKYVDNERVALFREPLIPQRMIAMGFVGDPVAEFFQLSDVTAEKKPDDPEGRHITMRFNYDTFDPPVDERMFWNWVEGKKRAVATERLQRLTHDFTLASTVRARFITDLPTSNELAQLRLGVANDKEEERNINGVLQLDLPFFDEVSLKAIVSARQNEVAFEEFRTALDRAFKAVKEEPSSPVFQKRVDEITHDLLSVPLARVDQQMVALKRNVFIAGLLGLGTLSATILAQKNTLFGVAAIAAANKLLEMYKQNKEQEDKIKQSPSYFYWQVTRKAK